MIRVENVSKSFTLHNQRGATIEVMRGATFAVAPGAGVVFTGVSGAGKSMLMRMIYANYLAASGWILVGAADVARAEPREILGFRREALGYVCQFLRVVARVPTREVVAGPLLVVGAPRDEALDRAEELLARLNVAQVLWRLSPTTFSGGEQQRVNIARGFVHAYLALLLDEPTASLDVKNRATVLALIEEAKARGGAIAGIFHDEDARAQVATREIDVSVFTPGRAA